MLSVSVSSGTHVPGEKTTRVAGEEPTVHGTGGIGTGDGNVRHQVAAGNAAALIAWTSGAASVSRIAPTMAHATVVMAEEAAGTKGTGAMAGAVTTDRDVPHGETKRNRSASAGDHLATTIVGALAPGHHVCVV